MKRGLILLFYLIIDFGSSKIITNFASQIITATPDANRKRLWAQAVVDGSGVGWDV
ncbi:MAG: hypothetical protein HDS66_01755 [Bacteroidales bacterium]|nr:hypothetical protein [Bacteroidales bacterium]